MINFNYEGKDYNMTTTWDEMTLRQFIAINKIQEKNQVLPLGEEFLTQQLLEALSDAELGEFDEMPYSQAIELAPYLILLNEGANEFNNRDFTFGPDSWIIDGKTYAFHKDPYQYSLGEVADIKTYITNKKNDWDYLADITAVMIRPAIETISEAGVKYYKLTKRTPFDFEPNKQVILDMKLKDITRVVNFFLSGLANKMKDMNDYIEQKVETQ